MITNRKQTKPIDPNKMAKFAAIPLIIENLINNNITSSKVPINLFIY
jgi:hypothetical protein